MSTGSLYPDENRVSEVFRFAESARLDGVEVICDQQLETHDPGYLKSLVDRHGLPVVSLHAPFPGGEPENWGRDAGSILDRTLALAKELGARHVVTHVPERFYLRKLAGVPVPFVSRHGRQLYELLRAGELERLEDEWGVDICVENLPSQYRLIPDTWLFHWNALADWAKVHRNLTLDTTHWATKSVDPVVALDQGGPAVRHIHLSNYASRQEHLPPQYGSVDLGAFLRRIGRDAQQRMVIIELSSKRLPPDPAARTMTLHQAVSFARGNLVPAEAPLRRP